jgi:hypothetical protein
METLKEISEKMTSSDDWADYRQDGFVSGLLAWFEKNYPEKTRDEFQEVCNLASVSVEGEYYASKQAKAVGLRSLAQVSRFTGVSTQTLNNWHSDKPKLFAIVLAGCLEIVKEG